MLQDNFSLVPQANGLENLFTHAKFSITIIYKASVYFKFPPNLNLLHDRAHFIPVLTVRHLCHGIHPLPPPFFCQLFTIHFSFPALFCMYMSIYIYQYNLMVTTAACVAPLLLLSTKIVSLNAAHIEVYSIPQIKLWNVDFLLFVSLYKLVIINPMPDKSDECIICA